MWHTRSETNSGALRRFSFRFLLSESALPCSRSPSAGGLPLRSLEVSDTMPHVHPRAGLLQSAKQRRAWLHLRVSHF
jgi:hypothetical protein